MNLKNAINLFKFNVPITATRKTTVDHFYSKCSKFLHVGHASTGTYVHMYINRLFRRRLEEKSINLTVIITTLSTGNIEK